MGRALPLAGLALLLALGLLCVLFAGGRWRADDAFESLVSVDAPPAHSLADLASATDAPSQQQALAPGERLPVEVASGDPAVLGTIVDSGGHPVAEASVTLHGGPLHGPRPDPSSPPPELNTTRTGVDGRFRFPVTSSDALYAVAVRASGFATDSRNQSPGVDTAFELDLVAIVRGRIVGAGARSARVYRVSHALHRAGEETWSQWDRLDDGQGSFAVGEMKVGEALTLRVVPEAAIPFDSVVTVTTPGITEVEIDLGRLERVTSRVLDLRTQRPVANARISATGPSGPELLATSDANGAFALSATGPFMDAVRERRSDGVLRVAARGYLTGSLYPHHLARGLPIELVPAGRVEGRVLEPDGRPAAGAHVEWSQPRSWFDSNVGALVLEGPAENMIANGDGSFVLEHVMWVGVPGLIVARLGGRTCHALLEPPEVESSTQAIELRLPVGASLIGRVVWEGRWGGRSVLEPRASPPWPPAPTPEIQLLVDGEERARARCDEHGFFRFEDLAPGRVSVQVLDHEYTRETAELGARQLPPIELRLMPPTVVVEGRVVLPEGWSGPAPDYVLVERCRAWDLRVRVTGPRRDGHIEPDGSFALELPSFVGTPIVLSTVVAGVQLERRIDGLVVEWSLPELAPVALELGTSFSSLVVAWRGPGPLDSGSTMQVEKVQGGRASLFLPLGELELELREPGRSAREPLVVPVRVERTTDRTPLAIRVGG